MHAMYCNVLWMVTVSSPPSTLLLTEYPDGVLAVHTLQQSVSEHEYRDGVAEYTMQWIHSTTVCSLLSPLYYRWYHPIYILSLYLYARA